MKKREPGVHWATDSNLRACKERFMEVIRSGARRRFPKSNWQQVTEPLGSTFYCYKLSSRPFSFLLSSFRHFGTFQWTQDFTTPNLIRWLFLTRKSEVNSKSSRQFGQNNDNFEKKKSRRDSSPEAFKTIAYNITIAQSSRLAGCLPQTSSASFFPFVSGTTAATNVPNTTANAVKMKKT